MAGGAEVQDQQWLDLIGLSLANYAYIYVLIIFGGGRGVTLWLMIPGSLFHLYIEFISSNTRVASRS